MKSFNLNNNKTEGVEFMDTEKLIEILIQTNDKQAKTNNETLEVIKMINRQNCIRDCIVVLLVILGVLLC